MSKQVRKLELTETDKAELESILRARSTSQAKALRTQIVLLCGLGKTVEEVAQITGASTITVYKWRRRFCLQGIDGLEDSSRSGRPPSLTLEEQKKILDLTTERLPAEATHWSQRLMAKYSGFTVHQVRQVWKAADLKPHRLKTFKLSTDPNFAEKVVDIVGLYMSPPENAVVLSVDEKTQIQALDRTQPMLPLRPGQIERRTHDYKRNGTVSLYAAFDIATGTVSGRITKRHRAKEFIDFLSQIDKEQPKELDLHLILDNSSTHKTKEVRTWLEAHPRFKLHFTPTSASWLNAVENWFGTLERRSLYRGVFSSVKQLRDEIHRFIRVHNRSSAKPFKWTKEAGPIIAAVERARAKTLI